MAKQRIDYLKVDRLDVQQTLVAGGTNVSLTALANPGVTGFTGSQNIASPNNTVNAARLLVDVSTANGDMVLEPKAQGALTAQLADGTASGGNKRGAYATDFQRRRASASDVASGDNSVIAGGQDNRASATNSTVAGGRLNVVSGSESSILGGYNNAITGSGSSAIGRGHTISGADATCIGSFNYAQGQYAFCGGNSSQAQQTASFAFGTSAEARAQYSVVFGSNVRVEVNANSSSILGGQGNWIYSGATYSVVGGGANNEIQGTATYSSVVGGNGSNVKHSFSTVLGGKQALLSTQMSYAFAGGSFTGTDGEAQVESYVLRKQTTTAAGTATDFLTADNTAVQTSNTNNTIFIDTDSTYAFTAFIVARRADVDNESAAWKIEGCLDKNGSNTAAFVGTPTKTVLGNDNSGVWDVNAVIETSSNFGTNIGSLGFVVTGQAGKTINWVGHIQLVKVKG
jgi:hypothetical protein